MNITVRSPNWIGDCVMAIPAIRALKYYFSESMLYLVTKAHLQDIFKNIKEIDKLIPISDYNDIKSLISDAKKLRPFHFDVGILFPNSFRSALLFRMSKVKKLVGYKNELRGFLLHEKLEFPGNHDHHRFFYLDLIEYFVKKHANNKQLNRNMFSDDLPIDEQEKKSVESLLNDYGIELKKRIIGISPSAAYGSSKEWLPERFEGLIERLVEAFPASEVLLFGSEKEANRVSRIRAKFQQNVHNLAGRLSLRESLTAISFCSLFISNDSGLMHIAASLRIPLIGIFGPTVPQKTAPSNPDARIFLHPVDCSPCRHKACPTDHRCMKAVQVDEVFKEANKILRDSD